MTPWAITLLNAANTLGEVSFPYIIGLAFERKRHAALGGLLFGAQCAALAAALYSWRSAKRYLPTDQRPVDWG